VEDFVVDIHPWGSLPLQIAVAAGVASFWRGAWYVMDGTVFPDDLTASGIASLAAGAGGLAAVQRVAAPAVLRHALKHEMPPPPVARYALLCGMAASCVAEWRGTWILWDAGDEAATGDVATDSPTTSGLASLGVAASALAGAGYLSSVLAPPAVCFLLDDEALRRRDCTVKAGTEEARREFLRGATWLFGQTAKRVPK